MDRDTEIVKMYSSLPSFKFDEGDYVDEMHEYISSTYKEHYAKGKYQATDIILDSGHGEGFVMGNILKYWKRYGNKEGKNRKQQLLKYRHKVSRLFQLLMKKSVLAVVLLKRSRKK